MEKQPQEEQKIKTEVKVSVYEQTLSKETVHLCTAEEDIKYERETNREGRAGSHEGLWEITVWGDSITVATEQRATEEVKVWSEESVAASKCGLALEANDLTAADESIQSDVETEITGKDSVEYELTTYATSLASMCF